jgi:hypothetical protein
MHVLLIRNNGEHQQGLGEGQGVKEEDLGHPHQGGASYHNCCLTQEKLQNFETELETLSTRKL